MGASGRVLFETTQMLAGSSIERACLSKTGTAVGVCTTAGVGRAGGGVLLDDEAVEAPAGVELAAHTAPDAVTSTTRTTTNTTTSHLRGRRGEAAGVSS